VPVREVQRELVRQGASLARHHARANRGSKTA